MAHGTVDVHTLVDCPSNNQSLPRSPLLKRVRPLCEMLFYAGTLQSSSAVAVYAAS